MTAFTLLQNLHDRDFDVRLGEDGRLLVAPGNRLTDPDRANIRANLPALKRLVSADYTSHPEDWSVDPDIPSRAVHVRSGHLVDSCLFRTAGGGENFLHRVQSGEPLTLAFHAACAFEDASQTDLRPNQTETQTEKIQAKPPHRKSAS